MAVKSVIEAVREAMREAMQRYFENRLREELPFKEIPMRLVYKRRRSIFSKN